MIGGGGMPLLTSVCPQFRGTDHRGGRYRQILERTLESVQVADPALLSGAKQLAAHLIVGKFGQHDAVAGVEHSLEPDRATEGVRFSSRIGNHSERTGIEEDNHREGNRSRSLRRSSFKTRSR